MAKVRPSPLWRHPIINLGDRTIRRPDRGEDLSDRDVEALERRGLAQRQTPPAKPKPPPKPEPPPEPEPEMAADWQSEAISYVSKRSADEIARIKGIGAETAKQIKRVSPLNWENLEKNLKPAQVKAIQQFIENVDSA